jgi:hypothetical protein
VKKKFESVWLGFNSLAIAAPCSRRTIPFSRTAMGQDVVLDPVHLASNATVVLKNGETLFRVLEDVEVSSEGGRIGLPGKDIRGVKGVLQATTMRLIWLERGSSSTDTKRSCTMPLNVLSDVATCTLQAHFALTDAAYFTKHTGPQ